MPRSVAPNVDERRRREAAPRTPRERDRSPSRTRLEYVAKVVAVGAAYYLSARLGLRLAVVEDNVTPLWPPTGIATVAFLLFGRALWPGVALAAFLVNLPISTDAVAAAATAVGNTLAPLAAATLLRRVGVRAEMDRLRDAVAIVFLGALAAMLVSATIGTATLVASDAISARRFLPAWAAWWAGDAMGVLVVAPFLLSLARFRERWTVPVRARLEALGLLLALAGVSLVVLNTRLHLLFLIVPLIGWASWRFQHRGAAPAALLVASMASWAAAHGTGPFEQGTLFERMLTLQAFNATVAFSSLLFAALVTERLRDREALERSTVELERRVEERTAELSSANVRLQREIDERRAAEERLRRSERQLADAQQLAHVGSWEWVIPEDRVTWSDEMFRIHGYEPQAFPVTFERAIELVVEEDVERIRHNVEQAMGGGNDEEDLPDLEYRIVRADGSERVLLGRARMMADPTGGPRRMVGTVQDITTEKRAEREHRIAETLQRSLLPERLPEVPGLTLAARYVPATADMEVGGDWFDVVELPDGQVGLVIGDVAGHGLRAAATMAQLRMSLRAFAFEEESPAAVIARLQRFLLHESGSELATLVYIVFDPETGGLRFANAGHPPPLVVAPDGDGSFLDAGLAPPVGAVVPPDLFVDSSAELPAGGTLLLFTDGLVERRGTPIDAGLALLRQETTAAVTGGLDLESLCDRVVESLVGDHVADDVALVALRSLPLAGEPLHLRIPAEPRALAPLRHALRRWLRGAGASTHEEAEMLVACGEACMNGLQHAYGGAAGALELDARLDDGAVEVTVRDRGRWRERRGTEGGYGLSLMRAFMDDVDIERGPDGTVVRMRRRLGSGSRT